MKKIIFILFVLASILNYSQTFEIKQITSGDFDARNPSFSTTSFWEGRVYYEKHEANSSNIILIKYNPNTNSFQDTVELTSGIAMRINPYEDFSSNLVYQTNENGNWDIAYKLYNNGAWDSTIFLENSSTDEINLSSFYTSDWGFTNDNFILFERSDTLILLQYNNSTKTEYPVLINSTMFHYSDYIGVYYFNYIGGYPRPGIHVIAVETDSSGKRNLVSKYKPLNGEWDIKNIIKENCNCRNPVFQFYEYQPYLIFEDSTVNNVRPYITSDWEYLKDIDTVPYLPNGDITNFRIDRPDIITSNPDQIEYFPHSYFLKNEDGFRIRLNRQELGSFAEDTLVNIKYTDSKMALDALGVDYDEIFYTIWEDSSDGHIHLFGRRHLYPIGDVSDEIGVNGFTLNQNYPNPFNPSTTLSFVIGHQSFATLKVYDVLGNEIATLVNEEKPAGEYEIIFDASELPSGIYFYKLTAGEYNQTRKMILLR